MKEARHVTQLAHRPDMYKDGIRLFRNYAAELNIDLCFQNFEIEIEEIAIQYGRPTGGLILVYDSESAAIGCVGIRLLENSTCELKRMYLEPQARNKGTGRKLLNKALQLAADLGYKTVRLDTLSRMDAAIHLYREVGFQEIPPYYENPHSEAMFFEKEL